jgi:uncharacterized protein (UPF0333 family)
MMPRMKMPNIRTASLDLSAFIKLAYLLIGSVALAYVVIQMQRGGSLATAAESASLGLVYAVGGLIVVFGVAVVALSFRNRT